LQSCFPHGYWSQKFPCSHSSSNITNGWVTDYATIFLLAACFCWLCSRKRVFLPAYYGISCYQYFPAVLQKNRYNCTSMSFIIFLIIIYFLFRIVSFFAIRIMAYKTKKQGDESSEFTKSTGQNKKKIFHQDDGEYVDFEEIDKK